MTLLDITTDKTTLAVEDLHTTDEYVEFRMGKTFQLSRLSVVEHIKFPKGGANVVLINDPILGEFCLQKTVVDDALLTPDKANLIMALFLNEWTSRAAIEDRDKLIGNKESYGEITVTLDKDTIDHIQSAFTLYDSFLENEQIFPFDAEVRTFTKTVITDRKKGTVEVSTRDLIELVPSVPDAGTFAPSIYIYSGKLVIGKQVKN